MIGTNGAGTAAIGNSLYGVAALLNTDNNRIGTDGNGISDVAERNVISGNGLGGIIIGAQSTVTVPVTNTTIAGNYIGTTVTGAVALGNGNGNTASYGIGVNSSTGTLIGGDLASQANLIAFNNGPGVSIGTTGYPESANRVQGNAIFQNTGLAIKNGRANYPALTSANVVSGTARIVGTQPGNANDTYRLDFYASATSDIGASNSPVGRIALGSLSGVAGGAAFSFTLPSAAANTWISATATDAQGNTTELSRDLIFVGSLANDGLEFRPGGTGVLEVLVNGSTQGSFTPESGRAYSVFTLDGNDNVITRWTSASGALIDGGEGSDTYTTFFGELSGPVNLVDSGSAGTDSVIAWGTAQADTIYKDNDEVTLSIPLSQRINLAGLESTTVHGGGGNDTITDPGENTFIFGDEGNDLITINATSGPGVVVDGGAGADSVVVVLGNLVGTLTVADSGTVITENDSIVIQVRLGTIRSQCLKIQPRKASSRQRPGINCLKFSLMPRSSH